MLDDTNGNIKKTQTSRNSSKTVERIYFLFIRSMQPTHEELMSIGFSYTHSDNYGRYYNLDITDKLYLEYQQEANKFFLWSDDCGFDMPLRFTSIVDVAIFIESFRRYATNRKTTCSTQSIISKGYWVIVWKIKTIYWVLSRR